MKGLLPPTLFALHASLGVLLGQTASIDWNRAQQLFQRSQRGETLSPEDQRYLDEAKRQRAAHSQDGPQGVPRSAIDWNRARELFRRSQSGEKLTPEDQRYLDDAKRLHDSGQRPQRNAAPPGPVEHHTPLTELTAPYRDQAGGLYPDGKNEPPAVQRAAASRALEQIRPRDSAGNPSEDGKIVLLSIGMSNTTQEFSAFKEIADPDPRKASRIVIVDGAQGGQDAQRWSGATNPTWQVADRRLAQARVTPQQVQAVWIKQAIAGPSGGFPAATDQLRDELARICRVARECYPNLQIAFLSSRIYAGYAKTSLNPEPYAYESAFAVRGLIEQQMKGDTQLNCDPAKGPITAPVLLWGPYLWADGTHPRKDNGLTWEEQDLGPDGTHPSSTGRAKVARLLLDFFTSDPNSKRWFTATQEAQPGPTTAK